MVKRLKGILRWLGLNAAVAAVATAVLTVPLVYAQTAGLQTRQLNSLQADGQAMGSVDEYYMLMGGVDSTGAVQALNVNASGSITVVAESGGFVTDAEEFPDAAALADDTANPTTTLAGSMLHVFDGTTWDRARSFAGNADGVAAPTLGLVGNASFGFQWNGTTWDRMRELGNGVGLAVELTGPDGSGNTNQTAGARVSAAADDLANGGPGLYATSLLLGFDGTDWDRIRSFNYADNVSGGDGTDDGLLGTYAILTAFDGTTQDRVRSFAGNADNVTSPTVGMLGTFSQMFASDTGGGNVDRVTIGHLTGSGVPGTVTTLGVDGTSSCAAAASIGFYRVQLIAGSQSRAHICVSGTSCTASATADTPVVDGLYYNWQVTDAAANDVLCGIAPAAGTDVATLFITALTY